MGAYNPTEVSGCQQPRHSARQNGRQNRCVPREVRAKVWDLPPKVVRDARAWRAECVPQEQVQSTSLTLSPATFSMHFLRPCIFTKQSSAIITSRPSGWCITYRMADKQCTVLWMRKSHSTAGYVCWHSSDNMGIYTGFGSSSLGRDTWK